MSTQYETFTELVEDARRFEAVVGQSFLDLVLRPRVECDQPAWVQEWAERLDEGDCHALCGTLPEDTPTDLDWLEVDYDTPTAPRTRGTRRPQALRQARARRTALLRRFGWR